MANTYLITGATSMIGIALCEYISSIDGNVVYAVCRENSNGIKRLPSQKNVKIIFSEIQNIAKIAEQIHHVDIFINLAWTNTDHQGRNDAYLQGLNVGYAMDAIQVAAKIGCKLFVEAGSQAEYGVVNEIITEDTPCNPEVEYGKAKLKVLNEGSVVCHSLGLKYLHLRIFSVFGENDHPWTLISTAIDKMLKQEQLDLSLCLQNWNFLYSLDCAKQITLLSEHAFNSNDFNTDIFHIASNDTRQLKEYIEEMKSVLKSESNICYGSLAIPKPVTLTPSVKKTFQTIGFINDLSFSDALRIIVKKKYNKDL